MINLCGSLIISLAVKIIFERIKFTIVYGRSDLLHQIQIIMQVVQRVQTVCQKLPGHIEVPQIRPGIVAAGVTPALSIHRFRIVLMACIANI